MSKSLTFDFVTHGLGSPQEYDVVTVNGVQFATITLKDNIYTTRALEGSRRGQDLAWKDSHDGAFEAAMTYALRERLG